ncbi:uncharacterized protein TNCV_269611 [Trichonephila clavipes]|nr:uncharacterized protein TNCV_269611 [Trichonephila clavipes]
MKRKENFQLLPKELHQLKYEAISVPQGSVRLVKKTQKRKSSTCYLLITKGVTSSSRVPLKTRRERERSGCAEHLDHEIVNPGKTVCYKRKIEKFLKVGPSRTGHTSSSTKPGTASQGTLISRYGMEESAQIPVPKMKSEVLGPPCAPPWLG